VTAHVADIKAFDPPPDRVVGALTTGEFSWDSLCALSVEPGCAGQALGLASPNLRLRDRRRFSW
jgi:hypothetical protein